MRKCNMMELTIHEAQSVKWEPKDRDAGPLQPSILVVTTDVAVYRIAIFPVRPQASEAPSENDPDPILPTGRHNRQAAVA